MHVAHVTSRLMTVSLLAAVMAVRLRAQAASSSGAAYVSGKAEAGDFPLSVNGRPAALYVSAQDFAGVRRAATALRGDIGRVTGTEPPISMDSTPPGATAVIIGTLGRSPVVDNLVHARKLDVSGVAGHWESYVIEVVPNPLPGVSQALIIAGSDKRGTIYGIYDLAARIGVSPWYWWADVPVRHERNLFVRRGRYAQGEPAVKYRGIFINDEAPAFSGWTREKFGGVNHAVYEKVFELILRLKGNYLWPAMWGNAFADDDSLNAPLADEYGIVMGTSHHEPLTRAQQEWRRYGHGRRDDARHSGDVVGTDRDRRCCAIRKRPLPAKRWRRRSDPGKSVADLHALAG